MGMGGLLTVLGRTGEGGSKAASEVIKGNIKATAETRKQGAIKLREENLAKIKHDYSKKNIELSSQLAGGREKESFKRKEGAATDLKKKYDFISSVIPNADAKEIISALVGGGGDRYKNAKIEAEVLEKASEMKAKFAPSEDINAVLATIGYKLTERKTGEKTPVKGTGLFGYFQDTKDETESVFTKIAETKKSGLLAGDATEQTAPQVNTNKGASNDPYQDLKNKINPKENVKSEGEKSAGLIETPTSEATGSWTEETPKKKNRRPGAEGKVIDFEDMAKTLAAGANFVGTIRDYLKAAENLVVSNGIKVGKSGIKKLAYLAKAYADQQTKARKSAF